MAKGNPFLGMLRGSVGDVTFSRFGGQQISRARNRRPKNPRSIRQQFQRATLASHVRFYNRAVQNLFKFAFESKRANESDYNAFMRLNAGTATNTQKAVRLGYPMIGAYVLSAGSLASAEVKYDNEYRTPALLIDKITAVPTEITIGQLSKALCDKYKLLNGDFITVVQVLSQASPSTTIAQAMERQALTEPIIGVEWGIKQFTIDTNSEVLASSLGIFKFVGTTSVDNDNVQIGDFFDESIVWTDNVSHGVAVIFSRNTANGVKVSNSRLAVNDATSSALEIAQTDEWKNYVGANWEDATTFGVEAEDILKGSITENPL